MKKVEGYADFIDVGRGKYSGGGNGNLWGKLYEWVGFKKYGINFSNDKERRRITWGLYRTIQNKGTFKHRNTAARTEIFNSAVNDALKVLRMDMRTWARDKALTKVSSELRTINVSK